MTLSQRRMAIFNFGQVQRTHRKSVYDPLQQHGVEVVTVLSHGFEIRVVFRIKKMGPTDSVMTCCYVMFPLFLWVPGHSNWNLKGSVSRKLISQWWVVVWPS